MTPIVSVIIPVYNKEKWLGQCLDSILCQSLYQFEIICVDDASTDGSVKILENYAKKDSRLVIIRNSQNIGAGQSRNKGLDYAKGKYCTFCDADDCYLPDSLKILVGTIEKSGTKLAAGNIMVKDADLQCNTALSSNLVNMLFFESKIYDLETDYQLWFPFFHPRYIFLVDFLKKENIKYPLLERGQDPPFLAEALCKAEKVACVPDIVYLYRTQIHGQNFYNQQSVIDNVMDSVEMVCKIFFKFNYTKLAAIYLYSHASQLLSIKRMFKLSKKTRNKIITNLDIMRNNVMDVKNLYPYIKSINNITEKLDMMKKGFYFCVICKIMSKFKICR